MMPLIKILLALALFPAHPDVPEGGGLVFDATEWDFGQINPKAGPINHIFSFINKGDDTIVIGDIKPSCICVQANISDKVIEAGEEGKIQFVFNPERTRGQTYRTIELLTPDGESLAILTISAECIRQ